MDSQIRNQFDINLDEGTNTYDPYRREAAEAATDETLKATRRFITNAIRDCERHAVECLDNGEAQIHGETWAYYRGKAEGLRLALRSLAEA